MKIKIIFSMFMVVFSMLNLLNAQKNNQVILCDKPYENEQIPCTTNISFTQYLEEDGEEYDPYTGDFLGATYNKTLYFYLVSSSLTKASEATFVLREIVSGGDDKFNLELDRRTENVKDKGYNMVFIKWNFNKEGTFWVDGFSGDDFIGTTMVEIKMP